MAKYLVMLQCLRSGDYLGFVLMLAASLFVVFCCLPVHELAHGLVADKCGDDTARMQGRLTINPFAHLDLLGTIMIICFGIGYAKPVPVNPARLKHPRRDMALIALAGPVSNLIMGFVSVFIFYLLHSISGDNVGLQAVSTFFYYAASVNVTLAVFNLFPIPPLDGSKILSSVLPDKIYFSYMKYERYIMIVLMVLLFTGALSGAISAVSGFMMRIISFIPSMIFGG